MEPTLHCAKPQMGCQGAVADAVLARPLTAAEPRRLDILVIHTVRAARYCGEGGIWVMRLIGLPGDTVSQRSGHVLINGKPLKEPYIGKGRRGDETRTWHVPRSGYFLMGDNRPVSCDSRVWGSLPRQALIGKAIIVLRR